MNYHVLLVPVGDYLGAPYIGRQIELFERIHNNRDISVHVLRFPLFKKVVRLSCAHVYQMPGSASENSLLYYLRNISACASLIKKIIARHRIDVIVVTSYAMAFADNIFKIFPYRNIPVLFDLYDHPSISIYYATRPTVLPKPVTASATMMLSYGLKRIIHNSEVITVLSHALREYVKMSFGRSSIYLPCGVSEHMFEYGDRERVRMELGIGKNETVVGFVGAIEEWLDLKTLLYGFKEAMQMNSPLRLVLVGSGKLSYLNSLRRLAENLGLARNVVFVGYVPHQVVHHYISAFDLCTIPFDVQNPIGECAGPVKMWEYLAQGKPVISTPIMESLHYKDFLSIVSSSDEYSETFLRFIEDQQPFLEKARKGQQAAMHTTWTCIAKKMRELLIKLVE